MESYRVRHQLACSALPPDTFRVAEFTGTETISQPFRFEIELASEDAEIDFEDVIDKPATLTIARGDDDPVELSGIVEHFVQRHQVRWENRHYYLYRVVLVPRLWRLSFSTQSRIYQDLTVQEIVSGILDDAGVDHEWNLSDSYEPREYTTQYKETDLEFAQRLLEFEGIRYWFKHEGGSETLVLSDDASTADLHRGRRPADVQPRGLDGDGLGPIVRRPPPAGHGQDRDQGLQLPDAGGGPHRDVGDRRGGGDRHLVGVDGPRDGPRPRRPADEGPQRKRSSRDGW